MNAKQRRFAEEYLIDLNATQAAIRAGYSERTAYSYGSWLLQQAEVAAAVAEAQRARSARAQLTADYVLEGLRTVVERCLQGAPVTNAKGQHVADEAGNHIWKFDAAGANRALELIGKHLGMFVDRRQVEMNATVDVFDAETRAQLLAIAGDGRDDERE